MTNTRDHTALDAGLRRRLAEEPWAMRADWVADPAALLSGSRYAARPGQTAGRIRAGSVEIIPIHGPIGYRDELLAMLGGADVSKIPDRLAAAAADKTVSAILLHVDSPGGTLWGVPEAAEAIVQARRSKPVLAVADPWALSAAYWLAAQADELIVTPSGEVGSIGVWTAHVDMHRMLEHRGLDVTLISAGKYKTEGHPFGPLGDEARAALQATVDTAYDELVAAVARGRRVGAETVRNGFGQGRMVPARPAVAEGMADRIADLRSVLAGLQRASGRDQTTAQMADAAIAIARGRAALLRSCLPTPASAAGRS